MARLLSRALGGFLVLALALFGGACRAAPDGGGAAGAPGVAAPATPARLVVSYSNLTPDQWPVWIAADEGLFTRHGLDVDLRLIESSTGVPALIAGETQAAALGGTEVLSAAAEGADLVIIAGLTKTFSFRFMAPDTIRTADDLRGKRVGVSRFGSSSDTATRLALQQLGLVPNRDVEVVQVGSLTARIQALQSGAIQGGVAQPPDTARLAKEGYHVLFDVSDLGLPAASSVVAVRRADLAERRPVFQALVDALLEAIALQHSDPPRAQAVLGRWLKLEDPAALEEAWAFYVEKVVPRVPRVELEQLETSRAVLLAEHPNLGSYDLSRLVDNSLVEAAVARGVGAP
ncbi:MAG TPA: ABC transporter substrate-binding protein [Chloroflexota bacterium]|nr:ABC transporter substrate-binding protein [Chloroflexota bacterium]